MRVVFLGTPEFAVPALRTLLDSPHKVCAVFTQPDRPAGRGQHPQPPPVKLVAEGAGITVHQPERIRNEENRPLFESLYPDFIVVVAYGQILPAWLLKSARIAPINVHASLLPKYRGAAPVAWAILKGEAKTGITTMLMDEQLDTGDMLLRREISITEEITGGELAAILANIGAELLLPTIEGLMSGSIQPMPQDNSQASYAPRLRKEQARIQWDTTASEIHNQIRALNPWPLACTDHQEQRLQVLRSRVSAERACPVRTPGTFLCRTSGGMNIECANGSILEVLEVRPVNRHSISGRDFAIGARLEPGSRVFLS